MADAPGLVLIMAHNKTAEAAYKDALVRPGGVVQARAIYEEFKARMGVEEPEEVADVLRDIMAAAYGDGDPVWENVVYTLMPEDVLLAAGLEER